MSYEAEGEFDMSSVTSCCRVALLEGVVKPNVMVAVSIQAKSCLSCTISCIN